MWCKMDKEKPDFFKILEDKLAQRSWTIVSLILGMMAFTLGTTLYALIYKDIVAGLVFGQGFSIVDTALNVASIIFLGQFLLLLRRVIRTKKGTKL